MWYFKQIKTDHTATNHKLTQKSKWQKNTCSVKHTCKCQQYVDQPNILYRTTWKEEQMINTELRFDPYGAGDGRVMVGSVLLVTSATWSQGDLFPLNVFLSSLLRPNFAFVIREV